MQDAPLSALLAALIVLIALSAFFSGSETGLMAINRYRLRHLAKSGHKGARRVSQLLDRPDRLIGMILLGNNFVNILASSLATVIAIRLWGEAGIALAAVLLTIILLIFGEVTPKTLAALNPERIAFPASAVLQPLLKVFYPIVWAVNQIVSVILKPLGASSDANAQQSLSTEELRTVVLEAGVMIPKSHQAMLLSILDMEAMTVDDIMVPRNDIAGIDLDDDWNDIVSQITRAQHTRLLVYRGDLDQVVGFLHLRKVAGLMIRKPDFGPEDLQALIREPYFIPEGTQLHKQLLNFQQQRRRAGLVVDEYGDLLGLVTLDDLLEEIIGEFTADPLHVGITSQSDGSYLVDGSVSIRTLNRFTHWQLPTDGPKTVSGLIIEYMEAIPEPDTCLLLADHPVEIIKIANNRVKTVLLKPKLKRKRRLIG